MILLKKDVKRLLPDDYFKGKPMAFKASREGVYIKLQGQRWTTAYFVPWQAIYSVGAKLKAKEIAHARKEKRNTKLLVRRGSL